MLGFQISIFCTLCMNESVMKITTMQDKALPDGLTCNEKLLCRLPLSTPSKIEYTQSSLSF